MILKRGIIRNRKGQAMTKPKYRFDVAYEKVYKWSDMWGCYRFLTTFLNAGIKPKQRDKTKLRLIGEWEDKQVPLSDTRTWGLC